MNSSKNIKTVFILLFLITLSSCSVWNNFTTYFNLWYNIKTLFNDVEKEIQSQKKDLFSNEPIVLSNAARNNLTKVIEKCSELLQFHSNTAYVDDALLILGKSFYYQSNFQKAKRKFEELLATNPNEDLALEANLWIAKCDMQLKNFTQGLASLKNIRMEALEKETEYVIREAFIEEIKHRIAQKEFTTAIDLSNEFSQVVDDDELKAKIYFEIGNLYYQTEKFDNAVEFYSKVFDYSPDIETEIKASIRYGKALRESGKPNDALNFFSDLRKKDKFSESFAEVDLEIGKSYSAAGDFNASLEQLVKADTSYKGSPFSALASLEIAKLYKDKLINYDSAAVYFSKTILNNPPKEYLEEAKNLNQLFARYTTLRKTINNYDKQLFYAENPDIFLQDSINYVQDSLQILQDYLAKKELADIWKSALTPILTDTAKTDTLLFVRDSIFVQDSLAIVDSLSKVTAIIDTAVVNKLLKDKTEIRIQQKKKATELKLSQEMQALMKTDTVKFKNNPPQKPKITTDSLKTLLAKNRLELGNLFFTELNVPDSAKKLYEEIIEKFSETRYYPEALLALGTYYQTINENAKADSLFRIIYDNYKDRPIANAAANKLGLPLIDLNYDPAGELYVEAETEMRNGNFDVSFRKFFEIYKKHPQSQYASKSLYAAGFILENDLRMPDSAASVYDTLISRYPSSPYVKSIAMKVNTYKQEKARIEREKQTQLQQQDKEDSTDVTDLAFLGNKEDEEITEEEIIKQEQITSNQVIKGDESLQPVKRKLERLWNPRKLRR